MFSKKSADRSIRRCRCRCSTSSGVMFASA